MGNKAGGRISSGWLLGVAATAATLAIGGLASGAPLTTKSATIDVPPEEIADATAQCKPGQKAVSGGFDSIEFDSTFNEASALPLASFRPSKRSWTSAAQNFGDQDGTLVGYAYCRHGKGLKAGSASVSVDGFEAATATAHCPPGQKVVSGGYDIPGAVPELTAAFTYESRKDGKDAWTVSAQSFDPDPATLTAYAYCRDGKGVKTKSRTTSVEDPPDDGTATAKCKKGQRVLSGGFDGSITVLPYVSRKRGARKWTVSAYDESGGSTTLVAYAYCEKKG